MGNGGRTGEEAGYTMMLCPERRRNLPQEAGGQEIDFGDGWPGFSTPFLAAPAADRTSPSSRLL
jgi:hypothetical protein